MALDHILHHGMPCRTEAQAEHDMQRARFHHVSEEPPVRDPDCSCRMSAVHATDIDPPHEIVDEWCPVHGRDPDAEAERRAEDREFFADMGDDE